MARPAKPPMTLREAKRAYKKDGGQFQFTASQMARADRQDAREEQRRKAIEKEKQRRENKRKRDEKLERERTVKQKLLEEGRIRIEDTWGKVTASQPRLNMFLVQKPGLVLSKTNLGDKTIHEDYWVSGSIPHSQRQTGEGEHGDKEKVAEDRDKIGHGTIAHPADVAGVQNRGSPTQNPTASLLSSSQVMRHPCPIRKSHSKDDRQGILGRSSALMNVSNSQLNARLRETQRTSQAIKAKAIPSPPLRPTPEKIHRCAPQVSQVPRGPPRDVSDLPHISTIETRSTMGNRGNIVDECKHSDSTWKVSNGVADSTAELCKIGTGPAGGDTDEEEDFTDGIDDETFLMLCATQKAEHNSIPTKQVHSVTPTPPREARTSDTPVASRPACSKGQADPRRMEPESPALEPVVPIPTTVHDSFSAVFDEIDDEDLIALAEEVEADVVVSSVSIPADTKVPPTREQQHEPWLRSKPISTLIPTVPTPHPRKGRILPWDESKRKTGKTLPLPGEDFGAPGPSTQAMMLELVEQAEAAIGS